MVNKIRTEPAVQPVAKQQDSEIMDIRTLCLGILSLGDATGYEIKKMVTEGSFRFFSEASYGSIYPALNKLSDEGLISWTAEAQSNRPDKKVYQLTNAGRAALEETLKAAPKPDKNRSEFLAALLFAEAVAPERIPELLAERIAHHHEQLNALEGLRDLETSTASKFVLDYGIAIQKAAIAFLEENGSQLSNASHTEA